MIASPIAALIYHSKPQSKNTIYYGEFKKRPYTPRGRYANEIKENNKGENR